MGEEVAVRQAGQVSAIPDAREITALYKLGKAMAASGMFADARQEFQAMTKLVLGRDLGLSATAAMTGIYIFDNKVELSSNLQAQMIRTWLGLGGERYDYSVDEHTDEKCVITIYRVPAGAVYGNPEKEGYERLGTGEFSMDDARRVKVRGKALADKDVWQNYPKNMLFARAISNAIAFHCPEVTGGVRLYAPGEASMVEEDPGARAVAGVGNFQARQEALERQGEAERPEGEPEAEDGIQDAQVVEDEPQATAPLTPEQQAEQDRLDAEFGANAPWATNEAGEIVDPAPVESSTAAQVQPEQAAGAAPPPAQEPPAQQVPAQPTQQQIMELQGLVHQGLIEIGENEKVIEARMRGAGSNPTALQNLLKFIDNKKQQLAAQKEGGQ